MHKVWLQTIFYDTNSQVGVKVRMIDLDNKRHRYNRVIVLLNGSNLLQKNSNGVSFQSSLSGDY